MLNILTPNIWIWQPFSLVSLVTCHLSHKHCSQSNIMCHPRNIICQIYHLNIVTQCHMEMSHVSPKSCSSPANTTLWLRCKTFCWDKPKIAGMQKYFPEEKTFMFYPNMLSLSYCPSSSLVRNRFFSVFLDVVQSSSVSPFKHLKSALLLGFLQRHSQRYHK